MSLPFSQVKCALTLSNYLTGAEDIVDHTASTLGYFDFVHKELVQFSYAHVHQVPRACNQAPNPSQDIIQISLGDIIQTSARNMSTT